MLYTKTVSGAPVVLSRDTRAGVYANGAPILIVRREGSGVALISDGGVHVISYLIISACSRYQPPQPYLYKDRNWPRYS